MFGLATIVSTGTSNAAVTGVTGSAYGYYSNISLFGGPSTTCGNPSASPCPNPAATLPAAGSATALHASLPSKDLVYGPAHIFDSGPIDVSTQGTPVSRSVTSSSSVQGCTTAVSNGCNAGEIYAGPFTGTSVSSTCTAKGTRQPSGSTKVNGGLLANAAASTPYTIPTDPAPNTTYTGTNPDTGKTYKFVFNQQNLNQAGVLTVSAVHEYLDAGASGAQGDLSFGQVVCGVTGSSSATTTAPGGTAAPGGTTAPAAAAPAAAAPAVADPAATAPAAAPAAALSSSQVAGSAYGYYASVSLFGSPPHVTGPTPTVTLPPGGSASPVTGSAASGSVVIGPANIFSSGQITISTQGTSAGGSVTSSTKIQNIGTPGGGFTADQGTSTCTLGASGPTGSTTFANGSLVTSTDPNTGDPVNHATIPANPPPNDTVFGTINNVGGSFKYVFNEQIKNPDGSITVNAGHEYLGGGPNNHGPALGDLIFGQSVCGGSGSGNTAPAASTTGSSARNSGGAGTGTSAGAGAGAGSGTGAAASGPLAGTGIDVKPLIWLALMALASGCVAVAWAGGEDGERLRGPPRQRR